MERLFVIALLVSLCSATSPPYPYVIPVDCNETIFETEVAVNLINEERDEGFVFKPIRVESAFRQASEKLPGGFIYYVDLDVIETECSVLSGKSWKECNEYIPFHEMVFGHCKAVIFIAKPLRLFKLIRYNCTLGTVPSREIVMQCPDCPLPVQDINSELKTKVNRLTEKYNKDSNETHYFKVDEIERVRTQYVFGQSYFFSFTIKETECLKTQGDVNLADCKFLKDHEAEVGFCKGGTYYTPDHKEEFKVSCEIYEPRDDDGHRHGHCDHGPDHSKNEKGQEKSNVPGAEETEVKQEGTGEGEGATSNCELHKRGRCHPHKGRKHSRCRHDHHHHHHPHHHHHHHDHNNDSHAEHHHHPHHHHHHDHPHHGHSHDHHHHDHHNRNSSDDGSSSEENHDHKHFEKRSKGSVQFYYPSDQTSVPVPTIFRLPPPPEKPGKHGKHGKHDPIEFPNEPSKLKTCPGVPLVELPEIVKRHIFQ